MDRRWLVLAPHLDDAALSWGALLASAPEAPTDIVVATVFAGAPEAISPAARAFHRDCGLPDDSAVRVRRSEDIGACAVLGVTPRHLPFLDAIYRRRGAQWLAREPGEVLGAPAANEQDLVRGVSYAMNELERSLTPDRISACAAMSPHIDHEIVRLAALQAFGEAVDLLEDPPVVGKLRCDWAPPPGWTRQAATVTEGGLRRQLEAVGCYASQVRMLWPCADYRAELTSRAPGAEGQCIIGVWRNPHS